MRPCNFGVLLLLFGFILTACVAASKLRENSKAIATKITQARDNGAMFCAPAELAKAEANYNFIEHELGQGDFRRAETHYRLALDNIDKALSKTDPEKCDKRDKDSDGVFDRLDKCPSDAGPVENQGCPDVDSDQDTIVDRLDKCPQQAGPVENEGCPDIDTDKDNIVDRLDKCPQQPGPQVTQGCPDPDTDLDGVVDRLDKCPNEPGVANNNGCPSLDRDIDGIPDDVDQCPDVPGLAPTGCPKRVLVVKTDKQIQIKQQIRFKGGRSQIRGAISYEILDQIAAVLRSNPMLKIVIEGHTDSVGSEKRNQRLSQKRAEAVREALISRKIDPNRLEAIGYGESKPLESNKTRKGRAANRRVEFNIVEIKAEAAPNNALPEGAKLEPTP